MHSPPVQPSARPTSAARQCALHTHWTDQPKPVTFQPSHSSEKQNEGTQPKLVTFQSNPRNFQSNPRNVGVRGVAPRKTLRPRAQTTEGHQACEAGTWARRDLNPHVLSDTRT